MTKVKDKRLALAALDGMAQIVDNEQMIRGHYVDPTEVNEKLRAEGAICGGHKACAVGSLWIGGGQKPKNVPLWGGEDFRYMLDGVSSGERWGWIEDKPSRAYLGIALDALNEAAEDYAAAHDLTLPGNWNDSIEDLFEGSSSETDEYLIDNDGLHDVIRRARKIVEAS